jgi:hypothetical protein
MNARECQEEFVGGIGKWGKGGVTRRREGREEGREELALTRWDGVHSTPGAIALRLRLRTAMAILCIAIQRQPKNRERAWKPD